MANDSLEARQAAAKQELARELADVWAAIDALIDAAGNVPEIHRQKARAGLLRAGRLAGGDIPDAGLRALAEVDGARAWRAGMGEVYEGELISHGGMTYVARAHVAQAGWEPGSEGGRTLFRPLRDEPNPLSGDVLDFLWGERVPFGTRRRDPIDGKVYTPVKESGVTLYEPHYPHMVPSEYKLAEDARPVDPPVDPPEEWPAWVQPSGAHDAYAKGAKASHGGKRWTSNVNGNVWEPPEQWTEETE